MKFSHLAILSIIPTLMLGLGLYLEPKMNSLSWAEEATELRHYIGKIEMQQTELNEREKGMLLALKASLKELDNYYSVYLHLRTAIKKGNSAMWGIGLTQLVLTIIIFTKTRPIGIGLPITEKPSHTTTHTGP